jgi:hypothetical protein
MFRSWWRRMLRRIFRPGTRTLRRRGGKFCRPRLESLEDRTLLAALTNYGQTPLSFEANQGQTAAGVNFLARGPGYGVFLTPTAAVLNLQKPPAPTATGAATPPTRGDVLRLQIVGGNPTPLVTGLDRQAGVSNYVVGNDPAQWQTNVAHYGQVEYQDVYTGVNLVYHGNQQQLEYDFQVAPGVNPGVIRLAFQGTSGLELDSQGDLVLHTSGGDVVEHAPVVYQDGAAGRQSVAGQYVLEGDGQVGFSVGAYDPSRTLVIDPVLSYSTYLGGSGDDQGYGIAVDGSGNVYVVGSTASTDFPTANPIQATNGSGNTDVFVTKYDPSGAVVYSTYLGGKGTQIGRGIAVDKLGNAYVAGMTTATDFPTQNPLQANKGSGDYSNAFVTELNAAGSGLVFSTYLGGSGTSANADTANAIALDSAGNVYIAGETSSFNFPTAHALQPFSQDTGQNLGGVAFNT